MIIIWKNALRLRIVWFSNIILDVKDKTLANYSTVSTGLWYFLNQDKFKFNVLVENIADGEI